MTNDPVSLLASAIATQEGYFVPGSTPQVQHNPGDLRVAGQLGVVKILSGTSSQPVHAIATFSSDAYGIAALFRQLWLQVAEGQTVRQIINQWAPAADHNDTTAYLRNVLSWTGLAADIPVLDLIPPLVPLNQPNT